MALPIEPTILDAWPFSAESTSLLKNLTDASSSIDLAVGGYQITLVASSTAGAQCCLGAAAVVPTNGAAAIAGFAMLPGVTYTLFVRTAAALHGIMVASSATGTLRITKVR
jgi:hypothetical protein